jgi:hypothetical protein
MEASVKEFMPSAQGPLESGGWGQVDLFKQRQRRLQGQQGSEMPQVTAATPDYEVEDDISVANLPMQGRVLVIAGTTMLLCGGFIAALS